MKIILDRLRQYGLNEKPLTEADFHAICEKEDITVVWNDGQHSFYFSVERKRFIVLPKRMKGFRLLFAAFHELGHALMHPGSEPTVMWLDTPHEKDEIEANAVALMALIPRHLIKDLAGECGLTRYGNKLWQERCQLYFLYQI